MVPSLLQYPFEEERIMTSISINISPPLYLIQEEIIININKENKKA